MAMRSEDNSISQIRNFYNFIERKVNYVVNDTT